MIAKKKSMQKQKTPVPMQFVGATEFSDMCRRVEKFKRSRNINAFEFPEAVVLETRSGESLRMRVDGVDVVLGKKLSAGSYGDVFLGRHVNPRKDFIIKVNRSSVLRHDIEELMIQTILQCMLRGPLREQIARAVSRLNISTPTVPKTLFIAKVHNVRYIGMEKMGVVAKDYLKNASRLAKIRMLMQVCVLLIILQKHLRFMHRDMHLANLMLSGSSVALIDFGMSRLVFKGTRMGLNQSVYLSRRFNPTLDMLTILLDMRKNNFDHDLPEIKQLLAPLHAMLVQNNTPPEYKMMKERYFALGGSVKDFAVNQNQYLHHIAYRWAENVLYKPALPMNVLHLLRSML